MSQIWGSVSPKRLMETIVILWTLTELPGVPDLPKAKGIPLEAQKQRQLTFEREKGLVEILAFLASTTDDTSKVVAVCIEEEASGNSMTIRVATNSGDCKDVVSGLESISNILEKASTREQPRDVDSRDLFEAVVRMDFWRILSRLRSRHAKRSRKTTGKPVLVKQLFAAINSTLVKKRLALSAERLEALRGKVKEMHDLSSTLEDISDVSVELETARNILMQILKCASEIASEGTLPNVLVAARDLDPGLITHLVSAFGKLGRYHDASRDLIRAARTTKYCIFDKVCVKECQTPATRSSISIGISSTLESSISELIKREKILKDVVSSFSVQRYLGESYSIKSESFRFRTSSSSVSQKVHAEIQLLFFYEMNKVELPPRVICASKSPCYLCHIFFGLHGKYHVPDTHGRLYPGWILPTCVEEISDERRTTMFQIIDALHKTLVLRIQQLALTKRMSVNYPNESRIWTTTNWSASTVQSQPREDSLETPNIIRQSSEGSSICAREPKVYEVSDKHQGTPISSSLDELLQPLTNMTQLASQNFGSQVSSAATKLRFLRTGDTVDIRLEDTNKEICVMTENFNLTIFGAITRASNPEDACWVRCSLIDISEFCKPALEHEPTNVMSMAPGSEVILEEGSLHAAADLLIVARDQLFSFKYSISKAS